MSVYNIKVLLESNNLKWFSIDEVAKTTEVSIQKAARDLNKLLEFGYLELKYDYANTEVWKYGDRIRKMYRWKQDGSNNQ